MSNQGKFYESKSFKKISKEWKKKLKESGFEDLEDVEVWGYKQHSGVDIRNNRFKTRESIIEYFDMVNEYLHIGEFKTEVERKIWEWHCEGLSYNEIGSHVGLHKNTVVFHVNKIKKRMKDARKSSNNS